MRRKEGVGMVIRPSKNAFFLGFGIGGHHLPHPRRSLYTPQVETSAPPAHPDGLHSTGRARCKADHAIHGTHAQTPDTLHRSAPDTRQAAPGRSGRLRALGCLRSVSETEQIRTERTGAQM